VIDYLRLAGATLVVLAPGILVARALGGATASAAVVCTLAALFVALVPVFALGASLALALWLLLVISAAALWFAARRPTFPEAGWLLVLVGGVAFGWLLWFVLPEPGGDALFHLARVRKLVAFDELSLDAVGEFADGGLHPGYAFPLWHGFLALVATIAMVDPAVVVEREAAVLAPLSFLVVYEAGRELFRSAWLGGATLAATLGLTALAQGSGGAFRTLALPATAGGRQLLVPAALTLVFAYLARPTRGGLALVALGSLAVAVVHPTYALFLLLLLGGFAAARAVVSGDDVRELAKALAAATLAAGLFVAWLYPVARSAASYKPSPTQLTGHAHGFDRYPRQFEVSSPTRYRLAPAAVTRSGAVPVAALALVPLALFAARRRWAAFVLGGTVVTLALLLLPFVFPHFAEAVSLSQARRLAGFLPFALALAGAAAVLSRLLSYAVLPVAIVAGYLVDDAYPGDFGYVMEEGGPPAVAWIALVGGLAALAAGRWLPQRERRDWLPLAAAALFVLPIAVQTSWERPNRPAQLTPELVAAVRDNVSEGEIVLADPETSYALAAQAPMYVAVSSPAHVADTDENQPYERVRDWKRFVRTGEFSGDYDWLVLDRRRVRRTCRPERFEDERYVLCASTQRR
jgi:hypothetical protein